jgi:hypothetical protein
VLAKIRKGRQERRKEDGGLNLEQLASVKAHYVQEPILKT